MNSSELFDFLLPNTGDPLQVTFLALIVAMMAATIISTHMKARAASWELKWNRETPNDSSDDLDIEHGSVTDLWHAVATAPEKLAEIMPGMLLVVGLLGTFLGLGLALNHASNILSQSNALSASGAANSMQDLLGLLQGLGTKFKTSTWGITGFLLLKCWSEFFRFEEKRLIWVIGKVKTELECRKQTQNVAEAAKQEALFSQIGGAAEKIVKGFEEQIAELKKSQETLHGQSLTQLDQGFNGVRDDLGMIRDETCTAADSMVKGFVQQASQLLASSEALHENTMSNLDQGFKGVRDDLGKICDETRTTNTAMGQFTQGTQDIVSNMAEAAQRMAGGADKVGNAAKGLLDAVSAFEKQFTEVLEEVRKDLGAAIHDMSTQATETLERGSVQLGEATREISTALGVLSADVKETMGAVKGSIEKALEIQEKGARKFTESSTVLNENIAATTGIVEKLGRTIEEGLGSVATSGQQMRGIGDTLKKWLF